MSTASSVSSLSCTSSTSKTPRRNLSSTVIGKKILFEKSPEKRVCKSIQTSPAHGRIAQLPRCIGSHEMINGELSSIANDSTEQVESKYFRNIVENTSDKTKMLSQNNDLNVQMNRSPIKSVKLLNNLNALKLK